jgi:hypothetical protein
LNPRPLAPQASALPGCATLRTPPVKIRNSVKECKHLLPVGECDDGGGAMVWIFASLSLTTLLRGTPVRPLFVHEDKGHEGGLRGHRNSFCGDNSPACSFRVCVELKLDVRLLGIVDHSTAPTMPATRTRPAESAAVRGGKLQSKGLGFGARCSKPSRLDTLLKHRNLRHAGWRLKRAFRFRKVLWLLSSKESNNKNKRCTVFASRHGP